MKRSPFQNVKHTWATATAAGAAAAITIAANAAERWVLEYVAWNYTTAPAGGNLTIVFTQAGTAITITRTLAAAAGGDSIDFSGAPIVGDLNTAITITLPTGGGAVVGAVWCRYH
jgi:hypothetical protein